MRYRARTFAPTRRVQKTVALFFSSLLCVLLLAPTSAPGQQAPPLKDETASSSPVEPAARAPNRETTPTNTASPTPARLSREEREQLSRRIDAVANPDRASASSAPSPEPMGYGALLLQMMVSLGVVCLLAYLLLKYGLKRLLPDQSKQGQMQVLARLPLEPRRTLLVVKVGEKFLVLASSEAGVHPVSELSKEEAAAFVEEGEVRQGMEAAKKRAFSLDLGDEDEATS